MNQVMFDASTNEEIIFKYFLDKLARNYTQTNKRSQI